MTDRQAIHGFVLCGLGTLILWSLTAVFGPLRTTFLLTEGGPVETASAAGYFLCAGLILVRCDREFLRRRAAYPVIVILLGLRELDFDKRFTTAGLFKISFYLGSDVSWAEKSLGGLVILIVGLLVAWIVLVDLKPYLARFRSTSAVSIGVAAVLGTLAIAKTLDGLPRKLLSLGLSVESQVLTHLHSAEEILELAVPILLTLTFSVALRREVLPTPCGCG